MVFVDQVRERKGKSSCHLVARSVSELHEFARKVGLSRWRFHNARTPHYDLNEAWRATAVAHGACEVTDREVVRMPRRPTEPVEAAEEQA